MTQLVVERQTVAKLKKLRRQAEIVDELGNVIGIFEPARRRSPNYKGIDAPFSEKELQEAERDPISYSTAEVIAYLEKL